MIFIGLLALTTVSIAGIAAFFSVYGLAQLFKGTFVAVLVMGVSLEAGKLIAASFLYRYWHQIGIFMKSYLIAAVILLMAITSMGIFGMLSVGYQSDTMPLKDVEVAIKLLTDEQTQLSDRKKEIDNQIASLPSDFVRGRQKLMNSFQPELVIINKRLPEISVEMKTLNSQLLTVESHVGPIVYIAKAMGQSIDDATKYLILLIIIVFDPLAVVLTIGVNMALKIRKQELEESQRLALIAPPPTLDKEIDHQTVEELPNEEPDEPLNNESETISDVTVHEDVVDALTLDSSKIQEMIENEIKKHITGEGTPDPVLAELSRKHQIVADIRKG